MRYEGNTCPGCGVVFGEDDDVVVCPECATAQHRECYNKKGECVNAHLHGEDFQWKPEKGITHHSTSTLSNDNKDKNKRTFECPNCGNMCDPDMERCDKCGTKFVMFGVNLAKKIQLEREKQDDASRLTEQNTDTDCPADTGSDIPHYEAPFKLGEGEGFEYDEGNKALGDDAIRVTQGIIEQLTGQNQRPDEDGGIFIGGPYRQDDKIDGVSANAIGAFVRQEGLRYVEKFRRLSSGSISFNWAALFFSPYWFFYRRLIKPGIIFMTIELIIAIFTTYFSLDVMAVMSQLDADAMSAMSQEALYEFIMSNMGQATTYIFICMVASVAVRIAAGLLGDRLYKRYVTENVKIMQKQSTMNDAVAYAMKNGGASILFGMASFFAYELLGYAIGMFFA